MNVIVHNQEINIDEIDLVLLTQNFYYEINDQRFRNNKKQSLHRLIIDKVYNNNTTGLIRFKNGNKFDFTRNNLFLANNGCEKFCCGCKYYLKLEYFHKNKTSADGYASFCKMCVSLYNKTKPKEYINNYMRNRRKNDPIFRLKGNIRSLFKIYLQKNKTFQYIGCTIEELKQHLEKQFDENMTWENYGSYWHIDHIKPCAMFDFSKDENIYKCWNYKNLRPLEKIENIKKSDFLDNGLRGRDLVWI